MPSPPRKLYARFVRQLVPPLALAFFLAAAGTAWFYYQHQHTEAESQRQQTLEVFAQVLTKPLWDCDSITARGIIEAMTLQPNVLGASALDQCAQKLIQAGEPPEPQGADTLSTIVRYRDEGGRSHALGELRIAFQPISVFTAVSEGLVPQLVIFLSMLAAVLGSAIWTFERTVGGPLKQLRQAMRSHQELEPVPPGWTEEITEVTQTYNTQLLELRRQARHDPLTGLGNRLLLEEHLQRAIRRARRTGSCGHVLLLDLDRFKPINDTLGHAAGDEVLRTIARRLLACVRDTDTVARLGGDEFVIVTADDPGAPGGGDVDALVQRIREALHEPVAWHASPVRIEASIGVAQFPRDGDTSTLLLAHADAAMYQSKQEQRDIRG